MEIKKILDIPKSLLYKWVNYDKRKEKKMGRPPKFNESEKDFFIKHPKVN